MIIIALLAVSVLSWFPSPEPKDYVRTAISCVLLWYLFDGRGWARWIVGVLAGIGGLVSFYIAFRGQVSDSAALHFLILAVTYTSVAFVLLSRMFVDEHFQKR